MIRLGADDGQWMTTLLSKRKGRLEPAINCLVCRDDSDRQSGLATATTGAGGSGPGLYDSGIVARLLGICRAVQNPVQNPRKTWKLTYSLEAGSAKMLGI